MFAGIISVERKAFGVGEGLLPLNVLLCGEGGGWAELSRTSEEESRAGLPHLWPAAQHHD